MMKWASALSDNKNLETAVKECADALIRQLKGTSADLLCVFVSRYFRKRYADLIPLITRQIQARTVLGCSASGVLADGRELENVPGLSLTAAVLPNVALKTFSFQDDDLPDLDVSPREWEKAVGVKSIENPHFILLADPFSIRVDNIAMGMDFAYPHSVKTGGLSSGAAGPGENAIFVDDKIQRSGAAGVALMGDIALDVLVAQGCRPIGEPLLVTDCRQNILMGLNGNPPLQALKALADTLSDDERQLMTHSLFIGLAAEAGKENWSKGDFLIRSLVGIDPENSLIAVGALLRQGQTVQFHLRDAKTSSDDLRSLLDQWSHRKDPIKGALLFTCQGRGEHLYGQKDHDSRLFLSKLGDIPLGGFFCNGELGPVGGMTHVHGYTSCFGLFREKNPPL